MMQNTINNQKKEVKTAYTDFANQVYTFQKNHRGLSFD